MSEPSPTLIQPAHAAPEPTADRPFLDLRGEVCPYTFVRTKLALEDLPPGSELEIWLDHRAAFRSVPRALREEGHEVLACEVSDEPLRCRIVVRSHCPTP